MAYRSGFFNAKQNTDGSYDRTYDANDISNYLGGLISDGVVQSSADALQVSVEQASMQVQIRPGRAFLNNRWFTADSVITLPLTRAHGTLSRITAVALHFDETNREVVPVCIDGTLASSPVPPTLDKTYLLLGLVKVPANPSNLSKITVTDSRKFVHALVNYDFNQEVLQKEYIQTFNAWFEGIKNQLGTDAAGNLQNQINTLKPKVDTVNNALNFNGQNTTAKGQFDVAGKLNAKNGLAIGGNDTFIVRRFTAPRQTVNYNSSNLTVVNINVPAGYSMIAPISATTTGCLCNIHSWNTTSVTLYVGNMWNDGYVLPAGEINVDVLLVRKAA
nr:MAG TPA: Receptor Binding Protein [Caudoviricetes sp.]